LGRGSGATGGASPSAGAEPVLIRPRVARKGSGKPWAQACPPVTAVAHRLDRGRSGHFGGFAQTHVASTFTHHPPMAPGTKHMGTKHRALSDYYVSGPFAGSPSRPPFPHPDLDNSSKLRRQSACILRASGRGARPMRGIWMTRSDETDETRRPAGCPFSIRCRTEIGHALPSSA
jgi:hypothetical protein